MVMLNDLAVPMRMGLSAFELDDCVESVGGDKPDIVVIHESGLRDRGVGNAGGDAARDPVQIIEYVPVMTVRQQAAAGR
jgi:hypothetical protein